MLSLDKVDYLRNIALNSFKREKIMSFFATDKNSNIKVNSLNGGSHDCDWEKIHEELFNLTSTIKKVGSTKNPNSPLPENYQNLLENITKRLLEPIAQAINENNKNNFQVTQAPPPSLRP